MKILDITIEGYLIASRNSPRVMKSLKSFNLNMV